MSTNTSSAVAVATDEPKSQYPFSDAAQAVADHVERMVKEASATSLIRENDFKKMHSGEFDRTLTLLSIQFRRTEPTLYGPPPERETLDVNMHTAEHYIGGWNRSHTAKPESEIKLEVAAGVMGQAVEYYEYLRMKKISESGEFEITRSPNGP